jgi:hypothetical protein
VPGEPGRRGEQGELGRGDAGSHDVGRDPRQ